MNPPSHSGIRLRLRGRAGCPQPAALGAVGTLRPAGLRGNPSDFTAWGGGVAELGRLLGALLLAGWLATSVTVAQAYVAPMMGGGQVAASMVHIDLYYDADANQFQARVDDSYGTPELRALEAGDGFDPEAPYAVLDGKAYNSQYGWNVGGFFTLPPGAAIWIEQTNATPGLEVYQDWGRLGSYTPIFGTAGSPRRWKWSGVMVHNTYAVRNPNVGRLFADYQVFFGDAITGERTGFTHLGVTTVHLEWTTVPVEDPLTLRFGAAGLTHGAPLRFLNAGEFVTNAGFVVNLRYTNSGPGALQFEGRIPMVAVAATAALGGPAANHAALGSCLELEVVSLAGPRDAALGCWEVGDPQPQFRVPTGEDSGTNRLCLSENRGVPGSDPFGSSEGRCLTVSRPGLYCLGFRLVDTSTNGPGGGPIHAPSELYAVYLQAGPTVAWLTREGAATSLRFGGEPGQSYYLERASALDPATTWETVAGPLAGTNRLQTLTDPNAATPQAFYRLRAGPP